MSTTSPTTSAATRPANGTTKERKKSERVPRTPVEVVVSQCNAALKKVDETIRKRAVKTLVAMHGNDE